MASDDLSGLLARLESGDQSARIPCMAQLRVELNKLISLESSGQSSARTTASLIQQAYSQRYPSNVDSALRATFFSIAAGTLRQVLVDYARVRASLRRSGGKALIESDETISVGEDRIAAILMVDDAIQVLNDFDPVHGSIVSLRFFAGLPEREVARIVGLPEREVDREWQFAAAWLRPPFKLPRQWFRTKASFAAMQSATPDRRLELLNNDCGNDTILRHTLETLLERINIADGWLDPIALPLAAEALVGSLENVKISHYEVSKLIGRGGMGEVYAARDVRLGREVAVKVLRDQSFAAGDVQGALLQEARAIAGIKHPSICTIYDVGEYERRSFLVLELLEGETLSHLLRSGPVTIQVFVSFAIQICEGLAAAHRIGVVHRDIKPSNLHVSGEENRHIKILDFGLARIAKSDGGAAHPSCPFTMPVSSESTNTTLAGTVPFMSPEQVKNLSVDSKSDIFSLGIVFYEMLTGARPFEGASCQITFDRIVNLQPVPPRRLAVSVPETLDRLVMSMLEKDPAARPSIDSVLAVLQMFAGRPAPVRSGLRMVSFSVVLVALLLLAGVYLIRGNSSPDNIPRVTKLWSSDTPGQASQPSLPFDGSYVVFTSNRSGKWHVYRQPVGGATAIDLTHDPQAEDSEPALSPDGSLIAFSSKNRSQGQGLYIMRAADGAGRSRISPFGHQPTWAPDGQRLAFVEEALTDPKRKTSTSSALYVISLSGTMQRIYEGDARQPKWSPRGARIAFVSVTAGGQRTLKSIAPNGEDVKAIDVAPFVDWSPAWSADGRYLFFCSDRGHSMNLWRIPLDERSGDVKGRPEPVTVPEEYVGQINAARNGTVLAYTQDLSTTRIYRVRLDGSRLAGAPLPIRVGQHGELEGGMSPSPDGSHVAFNTYRYHETIFVAGTLGNGLRQISSSSANDRDARWSPDGSRIAFQSNRSGTWQAWVMNADGSNPLQVSFGDKDAVDPIWSPDGQRLAFSQPAGSVGILDLSCKSPKGYALTRLPAPDLGDQPTFFLAKSWSRHGDLLVGSLHRRNGDPVGIGIQSVATGAISQLTSDGGLMPVWLPDSRTIVYRVGDSLNSFDMKSKKAAPLGLDRKFHTFESIGVTADGRWLYFEDIATDTGIALISLSKD